ncbi:MAG TPA: carboxypeptidase-like regulatory domain-containing protein [Edaphobacter sp.]|nr:carboxypeptidase-like regulatory domain-containing protein [Edaphobacter sp.]
MSRFLLVVVLVGVVLPVTAQVVGGLSPSPPSASSSSDSTVTGVVLNASSGVPVSRALVRLNDREMLTDHEGKFEFDQFVATNSAVLEVRKPGFYFSPEMGVTTKILRVGDLGAPIVARLYPEALLTGTLTGSDGTPLPHVMVSAQRSNYSEAGRQWASIGQGMTNSRGEFRLTVPPGDYRIATNFSPQGGGSSSAVLPFVTPTPGSAGEDSTIHMSSGMEERFDLHPVVSRTYMVGVRFETPEEHNFPMLLARSSDGTVFPVAMLRGGPDGDERRIALPSGTYTLIASLARDGSTEYGEASVTVAGHDISGVVLRLASVAPIPIQVLVDPESTSDKTPPTGQQLGLQLQSVQANQIGSLTSFWVMGGGAGGGAYLRPVPGTYRLSARNTGQWYVKSANYGTNDLLQQNMTVAAGAGSSPVVITVSNLMGGLQGTAKRNSIPASAWIYVVPNAPSAVPFYSLRSGMDGSFNFPALPPGSYQVICFESRYMADFHDPKALAPFATYVHNVTVTQGTKSTVDLDEVLDTEMRL